MTNQKSKFYFYFSSTLTLLFFLSLFSNSNIGSDWDSYALIGTYENFIKNGIYIPSRPPGFPIYELLIGLCIVIAEGLGINFEHAILLFQLSLLISLNFLIFSLEISINSCYVAFFYRNYNFTLKRIIITINSIQTTSCKGRLKLKRQNVKIIQKNHN